MFRFLSLGLILAAHAATAQACAMFTVASEGQVYFANNEDYVSPGVIWFVPAKKGRLARVNLGFDDDFAQGSMNERGLCFDCAALPKVPWEPDPAKKDTDNLLDLIMDRCGTVEEALAMFDEYNCEHLASGNFMFTDAGGACAVVTWDPRGHMSTVRRTGGHLLNTNDRLEWSGLRDQRYVLADRMLCAMPAPEVGACRDTLAAIRQCGKAAFTSYSNIFEPKSLKIHLFNLGNFGELVTLDLREELSKGARTVALKDLFKDSPAVDEVRAMAPRAYATEITLGAAVLDRYVGQYQVEQPAVTVEIALDGGRGLLFKIAGQPAAALYPESETAFRFRETFGTLDFQVGASGAVEGFMLHRPGDSFAQRIGGASATK